MFYQNTRSPATRSGKLSLVPRRRPREPRTLASPGFTAHVDNPWFPLRPGTVYVYRGVKDGKAARDVLTVTHAVRTIQGAPCVVVKDRLYLDGKLEERTTRLVLAGPRAATSGTSARRPPSSTRAAA